VKVRRGAFAALVVSFVIVAACGASPPGGRGATVPPHPHAAQPAPKADGGSPPDALAPRLTLASFADLAARAPFDMPSMREVARVEWPGEAGASVALAAERDTCYRASFSAGAVVRAMFVDEARRSRGDTAEGTSGLVPPRGPVCTRRGDPLSLAFERPSPDVGVRAVVWASP
jgi:hypothetical protein